MHPTLKAVPLLLVAVLIAACNDNPTSLGPVTFHANPCTGGSTTVSLAAAQTTRIDCSNGGTTVTLEGGGASYLIVPEFPTDQVALSLVTYSLASGTLDAASASVRARPTAARLAAPPTQGPRAAQRAADRWLRARARQLTGAGLFRGAAFRAASAGAAPPPAVGSIRTFHVLSSFSGSGSWKNVGAQLVYAGSNILLYNDTLSPTAGFSPTQLQSFGQSFDQVLFPIDTVAFGSPSDIDANARFIMLMSPVVNGDTPAGTCASQGYVAGFFDSEDFAGAADPNSNQGEIFYSIVPDSLGTSSCSHPVSEVEFVLPSVFLHELQHLINFSQHVAIHGLAPEAGWADEGMSIVAEELGSLHYEQMCPPPACRANASQLFPDSSQGFIQSLLYDSYQYALLPDTASITLHDDSQDGVSWRGGTWLLMRWLGDQFGNAFYRNMEAGPSGGVADIEASTGHSFPALFADFGLALYTDSLPGAPRNTAPAVNRFTTRNVKQLWNRLYQTSAGVDVPTPIPLTLYQLTSDTSSLLLDPGATTYFRLDTPAGAATTTIRFSAPGGAAFPAALKPQLAIFRLPPGQ